MARRIGLMSLLIAWICANGAALELLQCAAWVKMFAGYAPHMSVAAALDETFDPAKPCKICTTVAKARASEENLPANSTSALEKIVLALPSSSAPVVAPIENRGWPELADTFAGSRTERVPLPPPRA